MTLRPVDVEPGDVVIGWRVRLVLSVAREGHHAHLTCLDLEDASVRQWTYSSGTMFARHVTVLRGQEAMEGDTSWDQPRENA